MSNGRHALHVKQRGEWRGGTRRARLGGLDASDQAALEGTEGLGYRQGLAGTQLPTYHKHKGSAWPRTASQGGPRSKAGLLFNYLIHNRWHCIRLSRRGGLLSRALIEAFNTPVRVGRETASASTPPPTNSLNCEKKKLGGGEGGPQGYLYYTLIDPKWRISHRRGEKDLRTFNRRVALCSRDPPDKKQKLP